MTPKLKPEDLLPEPVRPESWECCGSDCGDACIQTIYWNEKAKYDEQQKIRREQSAAKADTFSDGLKEGSEDEAV
ncbi:MULTISPECIES: hypothetical protein [unclassified Neisseria]|uniref:hypothetical protein n=1 Tax=unclassified Neisseria TaxID=2623750 RepID=UPI002666E7CD|nr:MULTISPECIES: hypothetical protein [unclassified Neisseria]MDO1510719.1 hypothetical protein [Neisseria sp. MVDL19-042950]MDO1517009.1 hypothetical protein [Neisseria sp. MVDL18-041461]MDO1564371.1 hypothetical protein [Neisseria sp. MVDL20-010259]